MRQPNRRALWLVLGVSTGLLCLVLAGLPAGVWLVTLGPPARFVPCPRAMRAGASRTGGQGQGVTAAVEASFPNLCSDWRDKIATRPSLVGWFTNYDVICVFSDTTKQATVMTVNVLTCEVHPALTWPRDWRHLRTMLFGGGQKMPVCP